MDTLEKAKLCGRCADEKKAQDVLIMELKGHTDIADYFVLGSGTSERHVRTISEYVEKTMKGQGIAPYSMEGYNEGRWVIIDFRDIIVHIFLGPLRDLYDIESLWIEAKQYRIERENKN